MFIRIVNGNPSKTDLSLLSAIYLNVLVHERPPPLYKCRTKDEFKMATKVRLL